MSEAFPDLDFDYRRIGPRDVAKTIGGMGACGLSARCCSTFLTEFSPISIRMAKAQGVSLDPSEITGMCGRLRCCLIYEYQQYVDARKELPKRNKRVVTPLGEGKVLDVIPLKQAVIVRLDDGEGTRAEFLKEEIEPWDELEAMRRKAENGCERHENGGCDCKEKKAQQDGPEGDE
jgi:cell fate regulator YaaT (PSP1 superfamily)